MIKINKPWIESKNGKARCYCDILIDNVKKNIWFEVDEKYGKYLVDDRIDAYVIGLLNYAMRENHDIVSDFAITEELMYNINTILVPSIFKYSKSLHKIKIEAPMIKALEYGNGIGTGCSCGIDSFSAIYNHYKTKYEGLNITHLCLNNVGSYNECYSEYGIEKVKKERYEITKDVAKDLGIELIMTDSNFASEIPQNHYLTNTYSGCFAIYMLQKLWKIYYLASVGLDYSKFTIVDNDIEDSAHYDLLTLQCFSNSGIRIFSEGGEKSRLDKTRDIVDFKPAQKYLHVCTDKPYNCGVCSKCMRTLVSLDAIGKLNNFTEVFDINYYQENKSTYYRWLYRQYYKNDLMNEATYQILKNNKEFNKAIAYLKVKLKVKSIIKRIIPKKLYQ